MINRFRNLKFKSGDRPGSISFVGVSSMADKSFADSCNINTILAGYKRAGVNPFQFASDPGLYGDFSDVPTFQDAQNFIMRANDQFMTLDAKVRKRFDNDPGQFLAFVQDPSNDSEMYALGLKVKPVVADSGVSGGVLKSAPVEQTPSSTGQVDKAK
jgi:hypothetical protein